MKSTLWLGMLFALSAFLFVGCAVMQGGSHPMHFTAQKFERGKYVSKADNFQIILDASESMGMNGQKNFQSAKNFIASVNQSLPSDLMINGSLRTFGHSFKQSNKLTELVYGPTQYSAAGLQDGLDRVKYTGGNSPLAAALEAATGDYLRIKGKTAIVVVSDGLQMDSAPAAAASLKDALGDRVCIYTVWVGNDVKGKQLLEKVAKAGECGGAYTADELASGTNLDNFVKTVFLAEKPAPPPTPKPIAEPKPTPPPAPKPTPPPAPKPKPEPVQVKKAVVSFNLLFDFDKANIKDEMIPILEQVKMMLEEDKTARFTVAGYTDSTGPSAYNQRLSERRAKAVRNWLVKNGINASRLDVVGYGETMPKYDNATKEGRRLNRRVELLSK